MWKIILNLKLADSVDCTYWKKTEIRIKVGYINGYKSMGIEIFQISTSSNLVHLTTLLII